MQKHYIPIWFFIGSLLLLYGFLILGAGIYQLFVPPARPTVLAHLHAGVWWGGLLVAIGAIYCYAYWPGRQKHDAGTP
jgi:hypothetical protein